jgi:hypothetical protein
VNRCSTTDGKASSAENPEGKKNLELFGIGKFECAFGFCDLAIATLKILPPKWFHMDAKVHVNDPDLPYRVDFIRRLI